MLWISLLLKALLRPLEVPISTCYGKTGISLLMPLILQSEHWEPAAGMGRWTIPPFLAAGQKISVELIVAL